MPVAEPISDTAGHHVPDQTRAFSPVEPRMGQSTATIVHDLGNLIQVASSALNRVARDPGVSAALALREMSRFELPIADGAIAAAYDRFEKRRVVLIHTEVPSEFSGRGIGPRLAHGTF